MGCVLLVAEHANGKVRGATGAAFTCAKQAADRLGEDLIILAVGDGLSAVGAQLAGFGAARVLLAEKPALAHYLAPTYGAVVAEVAEDQDAQVIVFPASSFGKDLAPRVAALLEAGVASDVIELAGAGDELAYKRPMWAGNVVATVEIDTDVHVVTARVSAFAEAKPGSATSPVESFASSAELPEHTRFVGVEVTGGERPDLTEADVVIAGGRGLKSAEGFGIVEALADALGGAVGASRAAVDSGYAPNDLQIGQTGKVVAPDLYVAVAISGAIQHLAGMKNSKVIVAVNKDEEAPIFQVSDYGLVADAFKVIPELTEKLAALKG